MWPIEGDLGKTPALEVDDDQSLSVFGADLSLTLIVKWKDIKYGHSFAGPQLPWL